MLWKYYKKGFPPLQNGPLAATKAGCFVPYMCTSPSHPRCRPPFESTYLVALYIKCFMKTGLPLLVLLLLSSALFSQTDTVQPRFRFIDFKVHSGGHLYTGQSLSEVLDNGFASFAMRYGWQTDGRHDWEKALNYPAYGVGWYAGSIGDPSILGNPNALYGFLQFPISKHKRNTFVIEPELGLTYNLKPFDPKTNYINDAIGARFAVFVSFGFNGIYKLNRELDFVYGFAFTHFSNGRTVWPNFGLNMYGLNFGARYNFNRAQRQVEKGFYPTKTVQARPQLPKAGKPRQVNKKNSILFYQALGTVQNRGDEGTDIRYLTSSTVLEYSRRLNEVHGFSAGLNGFFDASTGDTTAWPAAAKHNTRFFPAVHVGYDLSFWKLVLRVQVGTCFTAAGQDIKGGLFARPAVRYDFSKKWYGQFGLKSFYGGADWLEFGFGAKLWNW